ncbi:MAG: hypothetical protein ACE15D_15710 [Candidatus Eisenbacteria bacterium]|nr:hypothetical protein [Candidatus Eisenbacteria bacterium]
MQRLPGDRGRMPPDGTEAWLPAVILAASQIAVAAALVWFLVVARDLQGRIALPRAVLPVAMGVAVVVMIRVLWRAAANIRWAVRRMRRPPPGPPSP